MEATISSKIKILPEHLIDQIKAGEVIERPSSLIKELLENSIDAKASQIDLHIVNNGLDLISVIDNGDGIGFDDLPYAFCRHATSKINRFEDLYRLMSFGFRGEALASMASISRLTCSSITKDGSGGKITIDGGQQLSLSKIEGRESGTSIFIKDLFYNTPVRLKFIKSKTSEKNAIKKILDAFIISNPEVSFSIKWDQKDKVIYQKENDQKKRIEQIFFNRNADNKELVFASKEYEGHKVEIFVSTFFSKGYTGKSQFLFANHRYFQDKALHQGIIRSTDFIWPYGSMGHYYLSITVPTESIDINVHPNKTQVKFSKTNLIFSLIDSCLKEALSPFKEKIDSNIQSNQQENKFSGSDISLQNSTIFPIRHRGEQKESLIKQQINTHSNFIALSPSYYLLEKKTFFSIDGVKLFTSFWKIFFSNNKMGIDESQVIPLLISEPFSFIKRDIDTYFDFLKMFGFELERVNPQNIVLRSIPKELNFLLNKQNIYGLLLFLEENLSLNLEKIISKISAHNFFLNISLKEDEIRYLIDYCDQEELIKKKIMVELNHDNLSFLHESL